MTNYQKQRGAQVAGSRGVAPHIEDRNRGVGLPSGLTDEGYGRLAATLDRRKSARRLVPVEERAPAPAPVDNLERRRFASFEAVQKAGFSRVATGFYKQASVGRVAHPIWELRGVEDGGGYELIRRKEERAVDLRQAGSAAPGTTAAVEAGIVRLARQAGRTDAYPINPARDAHRRAAPSFLVSLLQVPGGDVTQRKTLFSNEEMDAEGLERLVAELKGGPMQLTHDTWTDGEWEIRVRGPKGQLIHGYDSVGPDEIGGAKGGALLDMVEGIMSQSGGEGMPPEGAEGLEGVPPEIFGEGAPPPEAGAGVPPPEGGLPPAGPVAPSAAALTAGRRVLVVRRGQVADAVVMLVKPQEQALSVMFGGGERADVPMGDVIDSGVPMEIEVEAPLAEEHEHEPSGEDALIEVSADDLGAGPGGAGQSPFEVGVEPASEEEPESFEPREGRLIQAFWVQAVEFNQAFRPGGRVETIRPARTMDGKTLPAGMEFTIDGAHQSGTDSFFGLPELRDPVPGGDPFHNMRIRLIPDDPRLGELVIISTEALSNDFDMARGEGPSSPATGPMEEEYGDLPGGYGQTVQMEPGEEGGFWSQPTQPEARPPGQHEVDPYGKTTMSQPSAPAGGGETTRVTRRPSRPEQHGGY